MAGRTHNLEATSLENGMSTVTQEIPSVWMAKGMRESREGSAYCTVDWCESKQSTITISGIPRREFAMPHVLLNQRMSGYVVAAVPVSAAGIFVASSQHCQQTVSDPQVSFVRHLPPTTRPGPPFHPRYMTQLLGL